VPSTQVPSNIVDVPNEIIARSLKDPRIVLNPRPNHWPASDVSAYRANRLWQIRADLYYGHFMSPSLTRFLAQVNPGTRVLVCCQDSVGGITTVIDSIRKIVWTGNSSTENGQNGVHAGIWLAGNHRVGAPNGSIWGNYTLAISELCPSAHATSMRDPDGSHFIEMLEKSGAA